LLVFSTAHFAFSKRFVNPYFARILDDLRVVRSNKNPLQQGWQRAANR
jgi:hypothetical protein